MKAVRVLAPGGKCLMLLPKEQIQIVAGVLGLFSYSTFSTDYTDMKLFAHSAEAFHASAPLSGFTLSEAKLKVI